MTVDPEAVRLVIKKLVAQLEPDGVIGPSILFSWLAKAALVCKDFAVAVQHGMEELSEAVEDIKLMPPLDFLDLSKNAQRKILANIKRLMLLPGPPELGGWAFWDKVVYSPDSLDEQDETIKLELAAELLKLPKPCESGAQLQKQMLRLLGAKSCPPCGTALLRLLGVEDYPRCGTALLRLLALERSSVYTAWSCQDARQSMARAMRCLQAGGVVKYVPLQPPNLVVGGTAALRATLVAASIDSKAALRATVAAVTADLRSQGLCGCGRYAPDNCREGCCYKCCPRGEVAWQSRNYRARSDESECDAHSDDDMVAELNSCDDGGDIVEDRKGEIYHRRCWNGCCDLGGY